MKCVCKLEFCFNCGCMSRPLAFSLGLSLIPLFVALWCTRRKTCSNDPPCELWDERILLDPGEREKVDNADDRPQIQARPAPSPPSLPSAPAQRRPAPPPPPPAPAKRRPAPPPPPPGPQHSGRQVVRRPTNGREGDSPFIII